jgi:hypothetical protein
MKLTIRHSDSIEDWYLIERTWHDGRGWLARTEWGSAFCTSARICGAAMGDTPAGHSADVEGTGEQMLDIAAAIEGRHAVRFKRCGVDARGDLVAISSPRNGQGIDAYVTHEEALDLAAQIRRLVSPSLEERSRRSCAAITDGS